MLTLPLILSKQDKFYVECAAAGSATQLAFVEDVLVGAIACRLELLPDRSAAKLYVMTVGVLAPYRDKQIGTRLLTHSLNFAFADPFVTEVYLHVQVNNLDAISFYTKKFGFIQQGVALHYYKRLEPPDAAVLELDLSKKRKSCPAS